MHLFNITATAAEDTLVALSLHVPAGVTIGRPLLAMPDRDPDGVPVVQLLTDAASWWLYPAGAARVLTTSDGLVEVTTFRGGAELFRKIGAAG